MSPATARTGAAGAIGLGCLVVAAGFRHGGPAEKVELLAAGLLCHVLVCALVYRWGEEIYGGSAAFAAAVLAAFLPQFLLHAAHGPRCLAGVLWILAAVYGLVRCLHDPTVQRALLAGVAIAAALLATEARTALLLFSALMIVCRVATAERWEPRLRVGQGAVVSVVIAWAAAGLIVSGAVALGGWVGLGTLEAHGHGTAQPRAVELSARVELGSGLARMSDQAPPPRRGSFLAWLFPWPSAAVSLDRARGRVVSSAKEGNELCPRRSGAALAQLPLLLLVVGRRWRWERRYTDAALVLAVACLVIILRLLPATAAGGTSLTPAAPFLVLLAAGTLDHGRGPAGRRLAAALVGAQVLMALAWWFSWSVR